MASLKIDTTNLSLHQLREEVRARVAETDHRCSLLFESFAFKEGFQWMPILSSMFAHFPTRIGKLDYVR